MGRAAGNVSTLLIAFRVLPTVFTRVVILEKDGPGSRVKGGRLTEKGLKPAVCRGWEVWLPHRTGSLECE